MTYGRPSAAAATSTQTTRWARTTSGRLRSCKGIPRGSCTARYDAEDAGGGARHETLLLRAQETGETFGITYLIQWRMAGPGEITVNRWKEQESCRPWKSNVLPLLLLEGRRKTLTRPSSSSHLSCRLLGMSLHTR